MERRLADKSTRLMLDALSRAMGEPAGVPLFAHKSGPGLFPPTTAARQIAQRCKDDGLLRVLYVDDQFKQPREICIITDKGRDWLVAQASPRQVLEDFVRVLEERQMQVAQLQETTRNLTASLEAMKTTVQHLLPELRSVPCAGLPENNQSVLPVTIKADWPSLVMPILEQWHAGSAGDCPLPELFRRVQSSHPQLTIGQFHDGLRQLHEQHQVYLHPWTGPLYQLPEPPLALLIGHFVAYYASLRNSEFGIRNSESNSRAANSEPEPRSEFHNSKHVLETTNAHRIPHSKEGS
jgi:hypothetical protein